MIMLTKDNIKKTLLSRFEDTTYNSLAKIPNFNRFKDMQKATLRAVQAIKNRERIVVVGDYDVDGIVSTALMLEFFEHINYPIEYIIPNRFKDGYGISSGLLDRVEADLIITVDNGITAYEASDKCEQKGIDLIITDHHTPLQKLPNAYAIINPKQDDCNFERIGIKQVRLTLIKSLEKFVVELKDFVENRLETLKDIESEPLPGLEAAYIYRKIISIVNEINLKEAELDKLKKESLLIARLSEIIEKKKKKTYFSQVVLTEEEFKKLLKAVGADFVISYKEIFNAMYNDINEIMMNVDFSDIVNTAIELVRKVVYEIVKKLEYPASKVK